MSEDDNETSRMVPKKPTHITHPLVFLLLFSSAMQYWHIGKRPTAKISEKWITPTGKGTIGAHSLLFVCLSHIHTRDSSICWRWACRYANRSAQSVRTCGDMLPSHLRFVGINWTKCRRETLLMGKNSDAFISVRVPSPRSIYSPCCHTRGIYTYPLEKMRWNLSRRRWTEIRKNESSKLACRGSGVGSLERGSKCYYYSPKNILSCDMTRIESFHACEIRVYRCRDRLYRISVAEFYQPSIQRRKWNDIEAQQEFITIWTCNWFFLPFAFFHFAWFRASEFSLDFLHSHFLARDILGGVHFWIMV